MVLYFLTGVDASHVTWVLGREVGGDVSCPQMSVDILGTSHWVVTNAEARFTKSLRPRKPEGSLGRTAQDVHLDSHTAPEREVASTV